MKIMFIIPSMTGGGAERVISVLANEFVSRKIDVKILMTAGDDNVYQLDKRIGVTQIGERTSGNIWKRAERIVKMRRIFKQNRDYILVVFEPYTAFFACLAKTGLKMKMISSERNDPKSFPDRGVQNYAYLHSDKVVFQTEEAMQYFQKRIQRKGRVIANPISNKLPDIYTGKRRNTVVAVGRLEKQKNYVNLLYAFRDFVQKYSDYVLHIYGVGVLKQELCILAEKLGISENVVFEGFHEDILNEIRDAGMYVLSSDYEGISNSLLEAMGIGLPVISTDCPCGGSRMCIQDGRNGLLVPVGKTEALREAMEKMAGSGELASRLGQAAAEVRDRFSLQRIAKQWLDLLCELS